MRKGIQRKSWLASAYRVFALMLCHVLAKNEQLYFSNLMQNASFVGPNTVQQHSFCMGAFSQHTKHAATDNGESLFRYYNGPVKVQTWIQLRIIFWMTGSCNCSKRWLFNRIDLHATLSVFVLEGNSQFQIIHIVHISKSFFFPVSFQGKCIALGGKNGPEWKVCEPLV